MTTKLGPVDVPLRLDTSEALRQLELFEGKLRGRGKEPGDPAARGAAVIGTPRTRGARTASKQEQQRFLSSVTQAVIKRGRGGLHVATAAAVLTRSATELQAVAQAVETPTGAAALAGRAGGGLLRAVGIGAAAVAAPVAGVLAADVLTRLAPEVSAAFDAATAGTTLGAPSAVTAALAQLRADFVALKTQVTAFLPAVSQQAQLTRAATRLTGRLPDTLAYGQMFHSVIAAEKQLEDRFDQFKRVEAPLAPIRMFWDMLKRSTGL